jgi:Domain of unknown function (DUF4365)
MTSSEIRRQSERIFGFAIPADCAARKQSEDDYGIDYELEPIVPGDRPSGFLIKAQLKGTEELALNADERTVSYGGLPVKKMAYYLDQLRLPAVFILVDLASEKVYWTALQGNPEVENAYLAATAAGQQSMTVRLPIENLLPSTFGRMLEELRRTEFWIIAKLARKAASVALFEPVLPTPAVDETHDAFIRHSNYLRLAHIEQLVHIGKIEDAYNRALAVFDSAAETLEMRFAAAMNVLRLYPAVPAVLGAAQREQAIIKSRLQVTGQLARLTSAKNAQRRLRRAAFALYHTARLQLLARRDLVLFVSRQVQGETTLLNPSFIDSIRRPTAQDVLRYFRLAQRSLVRLAVHGHFEFLPMAWMELIVAVIPFLARLHAKELSDSAGLITNWLKEAGDRVIDICRQVEAWTEMAACATTQISFLVPANDPMQLDAGFREARKIMNQIPDSPIRDSSLLNLTKYQQELHSEGSEPTPEEQLSILRQHAATLGVDLENHSDPVARIVNIGLRDWNPERVLRNCRELHMHPETTGLPGQILGLATAGSKSLRCIRFGYQISGLELDSIYDSFRTTYCEKCPVPAPHPNDWRWTVEWQQRQGDRAGAEN